MNARISGLIGVMAALAVGCKSDPTATGAGTPTAVVANFSSLTMSLGTSSSFIAQIVDSRLTPLGGAITFTSCDASAVTVATDPTYHPVPNTSTRAVVNGVGLNKVCVIASASGVKPDTVSVTVLPVVFPGAISGPAAPQPGSVVTITTGAATLQFDTAAVTVAFGTEFDTAVVLAKSASSVTVAVPAFTADSLRIGGMVLTYTGKSIALATPKITPGASLYAGTSSFATAPDISSLLPASGVTDTLYPAQPLANNQAVCPEAYLGFGSAGPCVLLKFTLAAPTTLSFTVNWIGGATSPDIDIYTCSAATAATACDFEDGGNGATGSKPQSTGLHAFPAGSHYVVIEDFSGGAVANYTFSIARQ
jgi:hypothetical protein